MNREAALRLFVREHLPKLTTPSTNASLVKALRKEFFTKRKLRSEATFSNREVAEATVNEIAKAKKRQPVEEILEQIRQIPFLREELGDEWLVLTLRKESADAASILTAEDLRALKQDEHLHRIEQEFEERALRRAEEVIASEQERLQDLKFQLESEREGLERFRSELDQLPPRVEIRPAEIEVIDPAPKEKGIWWKELGLSANPFPSEQGLNGIPEDVYDRVVVRTTFVENYLNVAEQESEEFFGKGIAILGEFGSGKTTLLQILAHKLGARGILPIGVTLNPSPDTASLATELLRQTGDELYRFLKNRPDLAYHSVNSLSDLAPLLAEFRKEDHRGILLWIDGLHKGTQYLHQTWEFLQQLQNVQEYIEARGVRTGVLVAGSPFWAKELENSPVMSGSIYKAEIVPPLTEEDAVEAIIRRIHAFAVPGAAAPTIRRESLRAAFKILTKRSQKPQTFRSFLNHIRDRLRLGEYADVGVNISSYTESLEEIRSRFRQSAFGKNFEAVEAEVAKVPSLGKALGIILQAIYENDGIEEHEDLFLRFKKVFQLLRTNALISQRRSLRGGPFVWSISPGLARVLEEICQSYGMVPGEVLASLFEPRPQTVSREAETLYSDVRNSAHALSSRWRESWPELSLHLTSMVRVIDEIETEISSGRGLTAGVDSISASSQIAVLAVLEAAGMAAQGQGAEAAAVFQTAWFAPENAEEVARFVEGGLAVSGASSTAQVFGALFEHAQLLDQLLSLTAELARGEGHAQMAGRYLPARDAKAIHKARQFFGNQQYKETIEVVTELLESKVRDVVYPAMRLVYGERATSLLPTDIEQHLKSLGPRGHPRVRRTPDDNFFYNLSRSEYSKILFGNLRQPIFGDALRKEEMPRVRELWEIAFSLADRSAHNDKAEFFRRNAGAIGEVLQATPMLCEKLNLVAKALLHKRQFVYSKKGAGYVGTFNHESPNVKGHEVVLDRKEGDRIVRAMLSGLKVAEREFVPLGLMLSVQGALPEHQVAVLQTMLSRGWVEPSSTFSLRITAAGEKGLADLAGRAQAEISDFTPKEDNR